MIISDKMYDSLKWIAQILLPTLATFYFALAQIWHLPMPEKIVGTIMAIDTFLGVLLGITAAKYNSMVKSNYIQPNLYSMLSECQKSSSLVFSNTTYDIMVWIVQYVLPGLGALYFALSELWGFPFAEQIVGTIAAADAFFGILLGISSKEYRKSLENDLTKG